MIRMLGLLLRRDLSNLLAGGGRGGNVLPLLFFLAVVVLYPFSVGPDSALLQRTGGGVVWIAPVLDDTGALAVAAGDFTFSGVQGTQAAVL